MTRFDTEEPDMRERRTYQYVPTADTGTFTAPNPLRWDATYSHPAWMERVVPSSGMRKVPFELPYKILGRDIDWVVNVLEPIVRRNANS